MVTKALRVVQTKAPQQRPFRPDEARRVLWSPNAVNSEARTSREAGSSRSPRSYPGLHRQKALSLQFLPRQLAGASPSFRLLSNSLFRGFLVVTAQPHFAEDALALHFLLQHLKGLIDIVVADENLHVSVLFNPAAPASIGDAPRSVVTIFFVSAGPCAGYGANRMEAQWHMKIECAVEIAAVEVLADAGVLVASQTSPQNAGG
jgi:hypothetical protein